MVVCTVHLNRILLHAGPLQHLTHAATTAQDKHKKSRIASSVVISVC